MKNPSLARVIALMSACLLPIASLPARAADQEAIRRAVADGSVQPLSAILAAVQARHGGRVLDVDLERHVDGRLVYEIELLGPDQRKIEIDVDASTGAILDRAAAPDRAFLPLAQLLRDAVAQFPGSVLDVELENGVYQVEIVRADGVHEHLVVDPVTGQTERDDHRAAMMQHVLPMPQMLERVQAIHPGTVIEVELEREPEGGHYYELDIQDEHGRILELKVDAVDGRIVRVEGGL